MNKILIGSFLTAVLIISGTVNVKAQSKTNAKVIKRETVKKEVQTNKMNTIKKVSLKKDTPKVNKTKKVALKKNAYKTKKNVGVKEVAKDQMKKQPAKLNKK